jgi:hypothetical protein
MRSGRIPVSCCFRDFVKLADRVTEAADEEDEDEKQQRSTHNESSTEVQR